MPSVTSKFSSAKTCILWDLDDCPIPVGLTPASTCANIESALENMGYSGTVSMTAYSLKSLNEEDFESAAIDLVLPGSRSAKRERMFRDAYMWGLRHPDEPTNLLVISQKIFLDEHYVGALVLLKEKENNILLTLAQYSPSEPLQSVASSIWIWTSLSTGASPLGIQSESSQVSMSSVTSGFSTAKTCILWDVDECPIPVGLSPASTCANIKSALEDMGYSGTVSMTAYSLESLNKEDFESAAINFVRPGSRSAKRETMFVDLYKWGLQHRYEATNLMLISRNISEDLNYVRSLLDLKAKENNILLAQPENPVGILRGIPSSFWLWTLLSTGASPLGIRS